jgi:hypothetical protein
MFSTAVVMSNLAEDLMTKWTMDDLSGALGFTSVRRLNNLFSEIRSSAAYRGLFNEYLFKEKKFGVEYRIRLSGPSSVP